MDTGHTPLEVVLHYLRSANSVGLKALIILIIGSPIPLPILKTMLADHLDYSSENDLIPELAPLLNHN
jgi:hypothetical protein